MTDLELMETRDGMPSSIGKEDNHIAGGDPTHKLKDTPMEDEDPEYEYEACVCEEKGRDRCSRLCLNALMRHYDHKSLRFTRVNFEIYKFANAEALFLEYLTKGTTDDGDFNKLVESLHIERCQRWIVSHFAWMVVNWEEDKQRRRASFAQKNVHLYKLAHFLWSGWIYDHFDRFEYVSNKVHKSCLEAELHYLKDRATKSKGPVSMPYFQKHDDIDRNLEMPIIELAARGLFASEIEEELTDSSYDKAVPGAVQPYLGDGRKLPNAAEVFQLLQWRLLPGNWDQNLVQPTMKRPYLITPEMVAFSLHETRRETNEDIRSSSAATDEGGTFTECVHGVKLG